MSEISPEDRPAEVEEETRTDVRRWFTRPFGVIGIVWLSSIAVVAIATAITYTTKHTSDATESFGSSVVSSTALGGIFTVIFPLVMLLTVWMSSKRTHAWVAVIGSVLSVVVGIAWMAIYFWGLSMVLWLTSMAAKGEEYDDA